MSGNANNPWEDASNVERLKQLWTEGLSASEIMHRIPGATRSGICGKARRLGLESRVDSSWQKSRQSKPRQSKPRANQHSLNQQFGNGPQATPKGPGECSSPSAHLAPPIEPVELLPDASDPEPHEMVDLLDLKLDQCRFPIGEDPKFCGRPTCRRGFGNYCKTHAERCYGSSGNKWAEDDPRRAKLRARFRQMNSEHRQSMSERKSHD